eukprot:comp24143_c1_seq1/m.43908 comp24143_c1_seq1/g.43908  ORF comp24143_c1_seq1/g.43908 comp24143_c1_seq1/m.43908 type:complete len:314 (-) comp24143_c1_seq1:273-1214(-)
MAAPAPQIISKPPPHSCLLPPNWTTTVTAWLQEDIPSFDYGGFVVGDKMETATLLCKAKGVVCGVPFFNEVFRQVNCTVTWLYEEGTLLDPSTTPKGRIVVAVVKGRARDLLMGERTALNMLARASGIATQAREMADIKAQHGFKGVIAGTRKTTPGFRLVEKYALLVGGVDTHRMDLSAMVMLKDNHVWTTGSITNAVKQARSVCGFSMKIEVECQSRAEAEEAIDAGADVVMLDNFTAEGLKADAKLLKEAHPHVLVEASGGITRDTVADYFCPYIDVLSMGSLTQGVPFIDFSLKILKEGEKLPVEIPSL